MVFINDVEKTENIYRLNYAYALKGWEDAIDSKDPQHTVGKGFYFTNGGAGELTFPNH